MSRRAFTMPELVCVVPLMSLLCTCLVVLFLSASDSLWSAAQLGDMKSEASRAAACIFRHSPGCRLTGDNQGLDYRDGSQLRWEGDRLLLIGPRKESRSLLTYPVSSFLATRRDGVLTLHFELTARLWRRGQPRTCRMVFAEPERSAP